jgi:hypothetical protein
MPLMKKIVIRHVSDQSFCDKEFSTQSPEGRILEHKDDEYFYEEEVICFSYRHLLFFLLNHFGSILMWRVSRP